MFSGRNNQLLIEKMGTVLSTSLTQRPPGAPPAATEHRLAVPKEVRGGRPCVGGTRASQRSLKG